ncbi:MAG: hypothetical protein SFW35_12525 [Chitinophagales bacterium]|nr:hypothetical protein [Chitinophagales bacterium]
MKRMLTAALMVAGLATYAQNDAQFIAMTDANKSEVIRNLASSQYGDAIAMNVMVSNQSMATMNVLIYGSDKYIKEKEAGKRYKEFEVFDVANKDKEEVVIGLVTNTLERQTRYEEIGTTPEKIDLAKTDVAILQAPSVDSAGMIQKVNVGGFRYKGKVFVLLAEGDYRYIDGKAIVGDKLVVEEMKKGKPITAITFFYELQKAGIADKNMTVKEFMELSYEDQLTIVSNGTLASY